MDSMKTLAHALEELPDGSTLDLQPDRNHRTALAIQLEEEASEALRALWSIELTINRTLEIFKTLGGDLQKTVTKAEKLVEVIKGRVQRVNYITYYDRKSKTSSLPVLPHITRLKNLLIELCPDLGRKPTFQTTIESLITKLEQWRWDVQTSWVPAHTSNQNVHIPEPSLPLSIPNDITPLEVADPSCPLERAACGSGLLIAYETTVAAFSSWMDSTSASDNDKNMGHVQALHLVRDHEPPNCECAIIEVGGEGLATSWIRIARAGHTQPIEMLVFSASREHAIEHADEQIIYSTPPDSETKRVPLLSLKELADYLRIIGSTCPPYPLSEYSHRWFARHVITALRWATKDLVSIPEDEDPVSNFESDDPSKHEKGTWNGAQSLIRLAEAFNAASRHEYAVELANRAIARIEGTVNPVATEARRNPYAYALRVKYEGLAGLLDRDGDRAEDALEAIQAACRVLTTGTPDESHNDGRYVDCLDSEASALAVLERIPEALSTESTAITRCRELIEKNPKDHTPRLATLLMNRADLHIEEQEFEDAEADVKEALDIRRNVYEDSKTHREELAISLGVYAKIIYRLGRAEEALAIGSESIRLYEQLSTLRPDIYRDDLAERHYQQALYAAEVEDWDGACEHGRAAVEHRQWLFDRQPDIHRFGLAQYLTNWSGDLHSADRTGEAVDVGRRALVLFRDLHAAHPELYAEDLKMGLDNLATFLEQVGEWDEAALLRVEASEIPVEEDEEDDGDEDEDGSDEDEEHEHEHGHGHHGHHH